MHRHVFLRHYPLLVLSSIIALTACSRDTEPVGEHQVPPPAVATAPTPAAAPAHEATPTPATETQAAPHEVHWGYAGEGAPEHWGEIKQEFATCAAGKKQSPIDISGVTITALPALDVQYRDVPLEVVNNGHTIQANTADAGTLTLDGKAYELAQFHFHSPSEHTIGGKATDMVAHLVHKSSDGELAVIESRIVAGQEHPLLRTVWEHLPRSSESLTPTDVKLNPDQLLPTNRSEYFHYSGSLTTPPCSEGVRWFVLANTIEASPEQIQTFRNVFPMNARPVQPVAGRPVLATN